MPKKATRAKKKRVVQATPQPQKQPKSDVAEVSDSVTITAPIPIVAEVVEEHIRVFRFLPQRKILIFSSLGVLLLA